jgi:HAE1 family hydrophobic/amphiphilic exporter-1
MIMASQFESLWEPFLILFSIPFSLIGMAPALFLFGHEVSAMAGMGVVLLAGIVVNNGIVLIDFVNQSREEGVPLIEGLAARLFHPAPAHFDDGVDHDSWA